MGRYYSRQGGNIYIYVTRRDTLLDLNIFPDELNLFGSESAWRIKERMAIVNDAEEPDLDKAEVILSLNSYRRWDHPDEVLELFYALGDESMLAEPEEAPSAQVEEPDKEVIIPEALAPTMGPVLPTVQPVYRATEPPEDGVIIPPLPIDLQEEVRPPIDERPAVEPETTLAERLQPPAIEEPAEPARSRIFVPAPDLEVTVSATGTRVISQMMIDELRAFYLDFQYDAGAGDLARSFATQFEIIKAHWEEIDPIIELIAQSPHYRQGRRRVRRTIESVEGIDPNRLNAIIDELGGLKRLKDWDPESLMKALKGLPLRVVVEEEYIDRDVYENRLLKAHLGDVVSDLNGLKASMAEVDGYLRRKIKRVDGSDTIEAARALVENHDVLEAITRLEGEIAARWGEYAGSFLDDVSSTREAFDVTPALSTRPHYSRFLEAYRSYIEHRPRLSPVFDDAPGIDLEGQDLYERWCIVKIVKSLMRLGFSIEDPPFTVEGGKIAFEGSTQLSGDGKTINLHHRKIYGTEPPIGSYSIPRTPTISLEVHTGSELPKITLFEPVFDEGYTARKFSALDLDRLHVLHDSIVDLRDDERAKLVKAACVLHPSDAFSISYRDLTVLPVRPGVESDEIRGFLERYV
ncbi:MAG TPA: DUF2357 domain-containing protein [Patescibacteria group bacterium]|nr:DUF2357 domain-containing protein [Patescibacteria group bacterium]